MGYLKRRLHKTQIYQLGSAVTEAQLTKSCEVGERLLPSLHLATTSNGKVQYQCMVRAHDGVYGLATVFANTSIRKPYQLYTLHPSERPYIMVVDILASKLPQS